MKMRKSNTLMIAEIEELKDTAFDLSIAEYHIEVSLNFPDYLTFSPDKLRYVNKETIQTMLKVLERKIKKEVIENGKN
jgi:hypothetical protein